MDMTSILRRINKLLAIANDSRGDANECAAAAAQAENMMRKFNIEHADLLRAEIARGCGTFSKRSVSANMKRDDPSRPLLRRNPLWAGWLAIRCAKLNDCDVQYGWDDKLGAACVFRGFDSDVELAAWMFDYLVGAMIAQCRAWQRAGSRSKAESDSYRKGFILAVCAKLAKVEQEKTAEMNAGSSSRALVISKKQAVAEHFGEAKYGKGRAASVSEGGAFSAGREAGQKVDVARRGLGATAGAAATLIGG